MQTINIITGSTLGSAEYLAESLCIPLEAAGFMVNLSHGPRVAQLPLQGVWLLITSTHGAGELPDNLQPLFTELAEAQPDLQQLRYGVIALGDSSYDTFCQAGKIVDQQLSQLGAHRIGQCLTIDVSLEVIPEEQAEAWLPHWLMALEEPLCYANRL